MTKKKKPSNQSTEKLLAKLTKELEQQNFKSEEDLNKYMQENILGNELDFDEDEQLTDAQKAQDLIWDAWELEYPDDRIELALQALKLDENCTDAYNLLAVDKAKNYLEILNYYLKAINAGKKSLGKEFEELKGTFWGFHQTRPYMRAMNGLAFTYLHSNQTQKAIDIWQEMLELNPNDNQGVRNELITALLAVKKYKDVEKLISDYKDDGSATWLYSKAYLFFNQKNKKPLATKALLKAMQFNPYVPLNMFSLREMPEEEPEYIGMGDKNEAIAYVDSAIYLWGENKKTLKWLMDTHRKNVDDLDMLIIEREKEMDL